MIKIVVYKKLVYLENLNEDLIKRIDLLLSYPVKGAFFSPLYRSGRWDGRTHLFNKNNFSFQIGLLYRLITWLQLEKIEFEIEDERKIEQNFKLEYLKQDLVLYKDDDGKDVKLRYYQRDGINKYLENKFDLNNTRGIFNLPPRSGKSLMAGVCGLVLNEYPIVFVVHRIDLALQAKKTFEKLYKCKVGLVGDGNCDVDSKIVVTTIQSVYSTFSVKKKKGAKKLKVNVDDISDEAKNEKELKEEDKERFKDFISKVKVLICDEVHVAGSDMFQFLTKYLSNVIYSFGLSGTPYREDSAEMLVEQLFGPVIYTYTREQGVKDGFLLPINIYFVLLPEIEVESQDYPTQKTEGLNQNEYIPKAIKKILLRHKNKKMSTVIIIKEKSQGKLIHDEIKCDYLHGGVRGKERQEAYFNLNKKDINTILSTVTDIGVDIPSLDSVIIASPSKSKVAAMQRIRSGTPSKDKKYGYVFVLCPRIKTKEKNYLETHWKKLMNIYKKEKTFKVKTIEYGEI